MTSELAEQLKEAGFPQTITDPMTYFYNGANFGWSEGEDQPTSYLKIPTLSELIEACGDNFTEVAKVTHKDFQWIAFDRFHNGGKGKTPEEAVAKLWLALNKQ